MTESSYAGDRAGAVICAVEASPTPSRVRVSTVMSSSWPNACAAAARPAAVASSTAATAVDERRQQTC